MVLPLGFAWRVMELQALGSSVAVTELADINIINHALAWDCYLDLGMGQSLPTFSLIPRTFNPG